jgi:transposase
VRRSFKFLLRPTSKQVIALTQMLRDHCSLYNGALQERRDAYRHPSKTSVNYGMQSAQLKEIRAFDPECQRRWSFSSQRATLRRLDKAMQAFFRRVKAGQAPGHPRFRGVGWFNTVEFPEDGDGVRWNSTPHDPVTRVRCQGVGHVHNTSCTCPGCGHVSGDNRLTQTAFVCVACGYTANADVVGAVDIASRAGLVLREAPAAWREAACFSRRRSH